MNGSMPTDIDGLRIQVHPLSKICQNILKKVCQSSTSRKCETKGRSQNVCQITRVREIVQTIRNEDYVM